MKYIPFLLIILLLGNCKDKNSTIMEDNDFSPYPRVRAAYAEKGDLVKKMLAKNDIQLDSVNIFIRAFKQDKVLELWAKNTSDEKYKLVTTYDICKSSGTIGPKRREGDGQVPEGVYYIDRFNPKSSYHLSLGINYPNEYDKIHADKDTPGSDIFIHGACVTVGCLPMTDDKVKEIYLFAEFAKRSGQEKIPVHIFPFHLTEENISKGDSKYLEFWRNLKGGYDYFEKNYTVSSVKVDSQGKYIWTED